MCVCCVCACVWEGGQVIFLVVSRGGVNVFTFCLEGVYAKFAR